MNQRVQFSLPPVEPTDESKPRFRSGAVARMVRMPVATLRIWERRYGVTCPATTAAGHRLYSSIDVQRLALIKQLTDQGHAIGTLASLNLDALHMMAATHVRTLSASCTTPTATGPLTRVEAVAHALSSSTPAAPRRYDDDVLADFAGLSSTISCECPGHVAELLVQLTHFEAYTSECAHLSPADAELHAYLGQVAAASRALFEAALERVAIHEGLMLP